MSDIFFTESSEVPVPPAELRIRALDATPRPDGVRIDVHLELTPFQQRPNIEVAISNAAGREVAALSVVEAIDPKMDFTMHVREAKPAGSYTLAVHVFYSDVEDSAPANGGQPSAAEILKKARQVVDQRQMDFEID
ncbi:MAG: hypothetical protein M1347_06110 [Chloroflexi bacterium]|nr:hypothetical protein [Chloroflexota bacterium]